MPMQWKLRARGVGFHKHAVTGKHGCQQEVAAHAHEPETKAGKLAVNMDDRGTTPWKVRPRGIPKSMEVAFLHAGSWYGRGKKRERKKRPVQKEGQNLTRRHLSNRIFFLNKEKSQFRPKDEASIAIAN